MLELRSFLCCLLVHILFFTQTSADNDSKSCVKTPRINYLSDYTNVYKNHRMCLRVAHSKGITDNDGRIYISYRAPLKKEEDPSKSNKSAKFRKKYFNLILKLDELCKCIRTFILQGDWWIGAKHLCYVECDTVTLLLIGTPEKRFINAKPVHQGKEPIDGIIDFFGVYANAQVWNDNCSAKPGITKDGRKNVLWTCEYKGFNLPPQDGLCDYMYAYINGDVGNDILGKSATHTCRVEGDKFYLHLVANAK